MRDARLGQPGVYTHMVVVVPVLLDRYSIQATTDDRLTCGVHRPELIFASQLARICAGTRVRYCRLVRDNNRDTARTTHLHATSIATSTLDRFVPIDPGMSHGVRGVMSCRPGHVGLDGARIMVRAGARTHIRTNRRPDMRM